jgi:hypothetical protein
MGSDLVVQGASGLALSVMDLKGRAALIKQVMTEVMRDGEHYGTIPGCGSKKVLYKTGGELLMLTFRLSNKTVPSWRDLPGGHRECEAMVEIFSADGSLLSTGVGLCSSMETKYRYRSGPVEFTGRKVPQEYWTCKQSDPLKAQALIGGPGHGVKKNEFGGWEVVAKGESGENPNPADVFNTVLKMAKKRAFLDGIIMATAVSDIFSPEDDDDADRSGAANTSCDNKSQVGRSGGPKAGGGAKGGQAKTPVAPASDEQLVIINKHLTCPLLEEEEKARVRADVKRGMSFDVAAQAIGWMEGLIAERDVLPLGMR